MRMQDTGTREPMIRKGTKTSPGDATAITSAAQAAKPLPDNVSPEGGDAGYIAGDCMIVQVALHHATKLGP
jgi:hypothetical protein